MRVRALLAGRVGTLPLVALHRRRLLQPAVAGDSQHGNGAAAVVGHQQVAPATVDHQVTGRCAFRRLLVQEREVARLRVDRERQDRARLRSGELVDLGHRVQEAAARVKRQERRVLRLAGEHGRRGLSRREVEAGAVDAAARPVRVGTDVDGHGNLRGVGERWRREYQGQGEAAKPIDHGRDPALRRGRPSTAREWARASRATGQPELRGAQLVAGWGLLRRVREEAGDDLREIGRERLVSEARARPSPGTGR